MRIRELSKEECTNQTNLSICEASSDCFSSHLTHPVLAGSKDPAICITSSSKLITSLNRSSQNSEITDGQHGLVSHKREAIRE